MLISANSAGWATLPAEGLDEQRGAAALPAPAAESAGGSCAGALKCAPQPGVVFGACVDILSGYMEVLVLRLPVLQWFGAQSISVLRFIN